MKILKLLSKSERRVFIDVSMENVFTQMCCDTSAVVDTGSTRTVIDTSIAEGLGLTCVDNKEDVYNANGVRKTKCAVVRLTITGNDGSERNHDIPVIVDSLACTNCILGMDVLLEYRMFFQPVSDNVLFCFESLD